MYLQALIGSNMLELLDDPLDFVVQVGAQN